jgi:hypothetical protein
MAQQAKMDIVAVALRVGGLAGAREGRTHGLKDRTEEFKPFVFTGQRFGRASR